MRTTTGYFFMAEKSYTKPALTVSQQLEFLISQGLQIEDQKLAIRALETVSYYRLSSYLLPFKQSHNAKNPRQFKENATFEQVWQLYQFDRELRLLVADAIEKIEVAFRAALTNVTSIRFNPFWYVERNYFKAKAGANRERDFFDDYLKTIKTISTNKQELFIQHYHKNYDKPYFPPIWMMVEALSFGVCSKMFNNIQSKDVRNEIASFLGQHTTVIESWIKSLTYTRNLCAHHSRLWNRWLVIPPLIPKNAPIKTHIDGNYRFQLIAFIIDQLLETIAPESNWKIKLFELFERNEQFPGIEMGFINNWRDDPIWHC
ncbi:TPA: Abi family protein [Legionella pneumophila]|nr:Abi family protein [Legionella pneumophila]HAT9146647.1 Abi family protein [Legionella pneumophila subsp. pneumophila]